MTLDDEVKPTRRLLGIGSILHFANDGDVIWGSGINGKVASGDIPARQLDIRAVRGPKTAARLRDMGMSVPNVFGDPALLVPRLFKDRFVPTPNRDYVIVPNLHDLPLVTDQTRLVSPLWGWNRCIEEILSAKFVIASSLHGLILAEAFGVPARYLRLSETSRPSNMTITRKARAAHRSIRSARSRKHLVRAPTPRSVLTPMR